MNILILDDHLLFAEGIKAYFKKRIPTINIEINTEASTCVRQLERKNDFDLILLDLTMPDISGFELIKALRSKQINTPILVISACSDLNDIERALALGANGFLSKSTQSETLIDAVREVASGGQYLNAGRTTKSTTNSLPMPKDAKGIPPRTAEVLQLIAKGHSNKIIGNLLSISEPTVKWHVSRLFEHLNVKNRTSCVAQATRYGLISQPITTKNTNV